MLQVFLDLTQQPSATERITVAVDETSRRTGIFKEIRLTLTPDLGLASRHFRMTAHIGQQRLQPTGGHLDIAVQQDHIRCFNLRQGPVVSFGKPIILVQNQRMHLGKLRTQHVQGIIGRGIVGHPNIHLRSSGILYHRRQEGTKHLGSVPIQYD